MSYKLFLKDAFYPWDTVLKDDGPWHIVNDLEGVKGYVENFGMPLYVHFYGKYAVDAAQWMIDVCRDMGVRFPSYSGTPESLECIMGAKIKGQIYQ